jgi:hypothetical protein
MNRPELEQPQSATRGLAAALARGLALLLVAAVTAQAGDFASLSRTMTRGAGTEAAAMRHWSLSFVRAVRGLTESDPARSDAAERGPLVVEPRFTRVPHPPTGRAVLPGERVHLSRLDLPPPAAL